MKLIKTVKPLFYEFRLKRTNKDIIQTTRNATPKKIFRLLSSESISGSE